uniref:Uncharacterized protein n=1 Tax=Rhizophora mucronata TaxID=61149 RepID=A0A2P2R1R6_RHIMU
MALMQATQDPFFQRQGLYIQDSEFCIFRSSRWGRNTGVMVYRLARNYEPHH